MGRIWRGNAAAVKDVKTFTVGGTIEATDIFRVICNNKTLQVVAGSTVAATVASNIVTAWLALSPSDYPEFAEYTPAATSGGSFTATAKTAGIPGTFTVQTLETNLGAADSQTFSVANTTPATGPNFWDDPNNWSDATLPDSDSYITIENSNVSILYGLENHVVNAEKITISSTFTGTIGLPRRNPNGYEEYRPQYLQIGGGTIEIGQGSGRGSGRIKIDKTTSAEAIDVFGTGNPIENGIPAVLILGPISDLQITQGSVGVAFFGDESASITTARIGYETSILSDSDVTLGAQCNTTTVIQTGGRLLSNSDYGLTTCTRIGGTMINRGAGITTLNNRGGTFIDESTGTYTTVNNHAEYDRRRVVSAKTITTLKLHKGSKTWVPYGVTFTNPVEVIGCSITDVTFDFGVNKKFTPVDI